MFKRILITLVIFSTNCLSTNESQTNLTQTEHTRQSRAVRPDAPLNFTTQNPTQRCFCVVKVINGIILDKLCSAIPLVQSKLDRIENRLDCLLRPAGSLCLDFGSKGTVTTSFGGTLSKARAALLQPDGKTVAVGTSYTVGPRDFALARYNSDGSLDMSFGTAGIVTTDFGGSRDRAHAVVLQPDGKIVAAGQSNVAGIGTRNFALARYNSDGSPDMSFGTGGLVITDFGESFDDANAVVLQSDGKIVAAGTALTGGGAANEFALARYNSDGILDMSFGTAGKVTTAFAAISGDEVFAMVLQPDDRIIAVGEAFPGVAPVFALACYEACIFK